MFKQESPYKKIATKRYRTMTSADPLMKARRELESFMANKLKIDLKQSAEDKASLFLEVDPASKTRVAMFAKAALKKISQGYYMVDYDELWTEINGDE
jgi:hypothetical protein